MNMKTWLKYEIEYENLMFREYIQINPRKDILKPKIE